jgi:aminopeptidase N
MLHDSHSFARPAEARVTHVSLKLAVDFDRRILIGTATLDVDVAEGASEVILDTRGLVLHAVTDAAGTPLTHTVGASDGLLGAPLTIALAAGQKRVVVAYETSPDAEALQWLAPEQTAGGLHPFLFTQGHAVHARSWMPIQDSPALRITFDASITVPAPLVALMGAERAASEEPQAFAFRMQEPIPAYLFALAVGDLTSREMGPRTAVFSEPCLIDRAAHELAEMEAMVEAAESLAGPYRWGRFDVLIMPPSFPYGGMENPRLTFASPTLLAGDRSLTTVFVHELAHAWAGNLVINGTWDDFWLNEGTTVYLELRINEVMWGAERAAMLKSTGHRELVNAVKSMGEAHPDTRLRYEMKGRDPADGVTVIPYLKGAAFYWTLETMVGRQRLDPWLRSWFDRRAFQSVTTDVFLEDLKRHLLTPLEIESIGLDAWMNEPGLLEAATPPASERIARVEDIATRLVGGAIPQSLEVAGWTPQEWRHFLVSVLAARPDSALVEALDATFALSKSENAEVLAPWLRLQASVQNDAASERIERFLGEVGRLKYLKPLYADLLATEWGAPLARRAFAKARPKYHTLVRGALGRLFEAHAKS